MLGLISLCFPAALIWTLWYAINSDKDDIHPILNQLIPAGHCACETATVFECSSCLAPQTCAANTSAHYVRPTIWEYQYGRDDRNEGLTDSQCTVAFPGLFEDVDRASKHWQGDGNFTSSDLDSIRLVYGMARAMIHNGELYVIESKSKGEDHRRKIMATLSAMHRSLAASPDRRALPNVEFIFSVEDKASDVVGRGLPIWVFARKAPEESLWLMPDFGFWAWDNIIGGKNNGIGPYDEVVDKALVVEDGLDFGQKQAKLVWRGKLSFAPKLRRALLYASRGEEWNDVKELNWKIRANYMTLEDHCKYMFIAHVEGMFETSTFLCKWKLIVVGRSYSASLKYRQACRSVIVAHELQYIQHHHYLLVSSGPQQNYVQVQRDFADLPTKMDALLADPTEAQRIADNSVRTFRERYLTPAAEACYWRQLWHGYAKVSEPGELFTIVEGKRMKRGLRYETFVLLSSQEMLEFSAT